MSADFKNMDLMEIDDADIYEAFEVDGNEAEALNDCYLDLFHIVGKEAMLRLFRYYKGGKIECAMKLYRPEFVAKLAGATADKQERSKIARLGGYSTKTIENMLIKQKVGDDEEDG